MPINKPMTLGWIYLKIYINPIMAYTTHDHWTKIFHMGLAQGFCLIDFKFGIY
jgi:hypothetical protein